jgi:membrane-bound ClpP family serine protease
LASNRLEVARALGLPAGAVADDPSQGGKWRAIRIDLKGLIDAEKVGQVERLVDDAVHANHVNFVCLWIDSPGGRPDDCLQLAEFLAGLDPAVVRTVAYIPSEARAQAALLAMACDQIVMAPEAWLGGPGSPQMSRNEIDLAVQRVRDVLAPRKMRSWSLWAAMIDPQIEVFRCTRLDDVEYFCQQERASAQSKAAADVSGPPWQAGECVTTPSFPFRADGTQAVERRLANHTADSFAKFKQLYNLEDDPTLVEPGWADTLIDFLRGPSMSVLLLVVGGVALYLELHIPGIGLGGFVSAVCFLLFFWSHYLPGTAFWLEITLFLAGVGCLLTEVFVVPGTGIFGLGGGAMVLISLVLASQTFVVPHNQYEFRLLERSLLTVAGAAGGSIVAILVVRRWLPRAPVLRNVFLQPPEGEEARGISRREMLVDLENLLGARGVTTTQLTPGGKARFGNTLVDVMAVGELISRDTPVMVAEVHGNHVIVKPVDSEDKAEGGEPAA